MNREQVTFGERLHGRVDRVSGRRSASSGDEGNQPRSVEVAADSTSGPIENSFGVACRIKDELNYYRLVIGADGFFGIAKVRAGQNIWLAFHESLVAPINVRKSPGDASKSNTIRGDCIGNRLSLYANGRKLDDVEDDEFKAGDVGLRVGTEKGGAAVVFKDFVVRTP